MESYERERRSAIRVLETHESLTNALIQTGEDISIVSLSALRQMTAIDLIMLMVRNNILFHASITKEPKGDR